MTEVALMNTASPDKISSVSVEDMMKLTGQASDMPTTSKGLARLSINHSAEDDVGTSLPRGWISLFSDEGIT